MSGVADEWERVGSLLSRKLQLPLSKTSRFPVMQEEDDIATMTRKIMNYVKRSTDVGGLSDDEIAQMAGLRVVPESRQFCPSRHNESFIRGVKSACSAPDDDRLVLCVNAANEPVVVSAWSSFRKTGQLNYANDPGWVFNVENFSQLSVGFQYGEAFKKDWPQFSPEDVDTLIAQLRNKSYGGRRYAYLWSEKGIPRGSVTAKRQELNRAWRSFLETQIGIEYNADLQRRYIQRNSSDRTATVYEDKKNIPDKYVEAARNSVFLRSGDFCHVEIDSAVDLALFRKVEDEYERVRGFVGRTKAPTLRFRKTGRHRARGVYHPHVDNIAVDPRFPSSFLHEFAHHLDHTYGDRNLSSSAEFRPLLQSVQQSIRSNKTLAASRKLDYFMTPTEIFARSSEMYYFWSGINTSLNGDAGKYSKPQYSLMEEHKDAIVAYWDNLIVKMGGQVPSVEALAKEKKAEVTLGTHVTPIKSPEQLFQEGEQTALFDKGSSSAQSDVLRVQRFLESVGMSELNSAALKQQTGLSAGAENPVATSSSRHNRKIIATRRRSR